MVGGAAHPHRALHLRVPVERGAGEIDVMLVWWQASANLLCWTERAGTGGAWEARGYSCSECCSRRRLGMEHRPRDICQNPQLEEGEPWQQRPWPQGSPAALPHLERHERR